MERPLADLAGERLVRKAPNRVLELEAADLAYIADGLKAVEAAYGITATPDIPIDLMPGRALMRHMIELRHRLRPANADQREAWGKLAGAILILDTACAFANEQDQARRDRGTTPKPD